MEISDRNNHEEFVLVCVERYGSPFALPRLKSNLHYFMRRFLHRRPEIAIAESFYIHLSRNFLFNIELAIRYLTLNLIIISSSDREQT